MKTFKQKIYTSCLQLLESRIQQLGKELQELTEGTKNDSKSSAGDKHETSQAMMQIEYEKNGRLLEEWQRQKSDLEKIDVNTVSGKIMNGSFIQTNNGNLFLGAAIGKILVDDIPVMVISIHSPIGVKLAGRKAGDRIEMNQLSYVINEVD